MINRAPGLKDAKCEIHNTPVIGRLSPYLRAGTFIGLQYTPNYVIHWLRCEKNHWCIWQDKVQVEHIDPAFTSRMQYTPQPGVGTIAVPDDYVDPFSHLPIYAKGEVPQDNEHFSLKDSEDKEEISTLIAQIVGVSLALHNGKPLDAQLGGLHKKFHRIMSELPAVEKERWEKELNKRLNSNGLKGMV